MIRESKSYINKLILSLLVFAGFHSSLYSQTKISGVINQYGHVTGIGIDFVTVEDPTQFAQFAIGDTVLLIQMKGVRVYEQENASLNGTLQDFTGAPGNHEFLLISGKDGGTNKIIFINKILNTFDVDGSVQIIKVPSFQNSAVVDNSDLTCAPWDSTTKTGGILTMIVGKTLFLNKNIDVSGKGFLGGASSVGTGLCIFPDPLNRDKFVYDSSYANSGFKGESPATRGTLGSSPYLQIYPNYSKGKGPSFTGGGSGNGRFSGGGGGGNYGYGGKGDIEMTTCTLYSPGANGGWKIKFTAVDGGIFMGGGGGSSTYFNDGATPSPGGKGGGIVILVCGELNGNGKSILANGESAVKAFNNAGSGGGGGGGSVALYLENFAPSSLTISSNGGNGGDNSGTFGSGGGGGAGLIKISNISIPGTVNRTVLKGLKGARTGPRSSVDGADGESLTDFAAVLNGFLFNIIRSSVTGDQTDSICSNMMPQKITGSKPVGGTGPYTYLWQKSYNEVGPWTPLINDTDPTNYTPTVPETATVYFRRTITDSSLPDALTDVSKPVKIIVQPFIKNNIVVNPDTICYAQNPLAFTSKLALADGNGIYSFRWKVSMFPPDSLIFSLPVNTYTTEGYTPPPALKFTSWYKRIVTSGRCVDSTAIVKITVLDTIRNNRILTPAQDICFGSSFIDLSASTTLTSLALGGGDNLYRFRWISNINGAGWVTAPGVSNAAGYNPLELPQNVPANVYNFRRIVYSGKHDACVDTTKTILLRDYPVIVNNVIKTDQTIGYDSIPVKLEQNSGVIAGGSGIYTYSWVKDTINYPLAPGPNSVTLPDYLPPNLKRAMSFKRIVSSSACTDISNSVKIIVDAPITNTISLSNIALDTIYVGQDPGQFNGSIPSGGSGVTGDYSYKWYKSLTGGPLKSEWIEITGSNLINLSPGNLAQPFWFRRDVSSPAMAPRSTYQSNNLKITVLPKILNFDISQSQSVCIGKRPLQLKGATLSGGDGRYRFTWQDSTSLHFWQDIPGLVKGDSADFKPPVLMSGAKYRRIVYSGKNNCGSDTSTAVNIKVDLLPTPVYAGGDTTLYSFDNIFHTAAAAVQVGTGEWSVVEGSGTFDDYFNNMTVIKDLLPAPSINKFLWKVTNGKCIGEDILEVKVLDIFIPEGFSPNNDGINDKFIITGLDLPNQIAELKIVNSAGVEVFSTSNINGQEWTDWDGKNTKGDDLPEATYYYMLKLISAGNSGNGQVHKESGFTILKRY